MVRSPRLCARALVAATVWALVAPTGCATHSGDWSRKTAPERPSGEGDESSPAKLRLFLIGDTGAARRHGAAVARHLTARIEESEAAGVPSMLVWLGDSATSKRCDDGKNSAKRNPRAQPFADLAESWARKGNRTRISTVGEHDWQCGVGEFGEAWPYTLNYVVRLGPQAASTLVSHCSGEPQVCTLDPNTGEGLVELVVLDTAAWIGPVPPASIDAADRSIAEQRALLASLRQNPPTGGLQRILVTHHPIESAGPHGQGGLKPDSALLFHDEPLQAALLAGEFAGVISGHEHSLQVSSDLSPAIQRSSRLWLEKPLFQVTSGSGGRGDAGLAPRSWPFYQGISLAPDHVSNHPGFAELTITDDTFVVLLHARRHGRWETAQTTIDRRPLPYPVERSMPGLEPCLGCDSRDPREQAHDPRP